VRVAGLDEPSEIADFVELHFDELSQRFYFSGGIPSHDTCQRFWLAICSRQIVECFREFVENLKNVCSDIIILDGKTIRNSGKEKPLHIVGTWCHKNQMVSAQEKSREKNH
jgi:hypothetical protein